MKRGPRSGIFSVYILRNVDYILLTYSCPWFLCSFFFFLSLSNKNLVICLSLIIFHSKLYKIETRVYVLCNRTSRGLEEGFATWSTNLWANRTYVAYFNRTHFTLSTFITCTYSVALLPRIRLLVLYCHVLHLQ